MSLTGSSLPPVLDVLHHLQGGGRMVEGGTQVTVGLQSTLSLVL